MANARFSEYFFLALASGGNLPSTACRMESRNAIKEDARSSSFREREILWVMWMLMRSACVWVRNTWMWPRRWVLSDSAPCSYWLSFMCTWHVVSWVFQSLMLRVEEEWALDEIQIAREIVTAGLTLEDKLANVSFSPLQSVLWTLLVDSWE